MHTSNQRISRRAHWVALFILLCLILPLLSAGAEATHAQVNPAPTTFAAADFESVWQQADGPVASGQVTRSWLWGPAPGSSLNEPFAGAPGGRRLVQYFDKARMELNSAITDPTSIWRVTTGLLVAEMVQGQVQTGPGSFQALPPSDQVVAGDAQSSNNPRYSDFHSLIATASGDMTGQTATATLAARGRLTGAAPVAVTLAKYVPETGHNIADVFWTYMQQTQSAAGGTPPDTLQPLFDWLYLMGYPISEPVWCSVTIDGKPQPVLVQLFQRRVLTYAPSFPPGWQVQMGNVGQHYYNWRYGTRPAPQTPSPAPGAPQPPPVPPSGSFVSISGDSFMYGGSKITLKGTNYWLSNSPFVGTWVSWNGPQVQQELAKAHDLGMNAVRIGISYDHRDTMDLIWGNKVIMTSTTPRIKYVMTQFLQIAAGYGMKVIFVLFDWYDPYKYGAMPDERTNLIYLEGIVGPFVNDDRVLAWDLYNEPEFSGSWQGGQHSNFTMWLKDVAGMVKSIDRNHPVTVGVGNDANLWLPAKNGTTILSFVDFVAFHCYDAGALAGQIADIKAHTNKPILLEEMGWPTGLGDEKPIANAVYDENTQNFLYTTMLAASSSANIGGVFQWTLWDYWGSMTAFVPGHERFFGLVRPDGSFKPAAQIFKNNYVSSSLPSQTVTHVPLDTNARPRPAP
jgi:hypothetical protein